MLTFLALAWTAFNPIAILVAAAAFVLFFLALVLPSGARAFVAALGVTLLVGASLYQAGQAKGVALEAAATARREIAIEKHRADLAEATIAADRKQAEKDRAASLADQAKLRKLLRDLQTHPGADGVALPRDLARRLRDL